MSTINLVRSVGKEQEETYHIC